MVERQRWEYLVRFMWASKENDGAMEYYLLNYAGQKPRKYSPETMIPELDALGNKGWELVHMEPIGAVGKHEDVGFVAGEGLPIWSNTYFCVFKRPA
jgi:hypothetical protein